MRNTGAAIVLRFLGSAGLAAAFSAPAPSATGDEFWDPQFGALPYQGYAVDAMELFEGELYAGGTFIMIGGVPATNIARWDGTNWHPVGLGIGTGLAHSVNEMVATRDGLFVGGYFTNAGPLNVNRIAKWAGTNWCSLGSGTGGDVLALASNGNILYAGGAFASAGGISAANIATWDGVQWRALGPGVGGPVFAITVDSNSVYVGGRFTNAGPVAVTNIARWDGTNWHPLGNGLRRINGSTPDNGTVRSVALHRGYLYAGGAFGLAGNVQAVNIARWDGANWENIGGAANAVHTFIPNGADLYAGGSFINIGGVNARAITKWDGSQWSALGSGMWNGGVLALASTGTELFAGGGFTVAGDKPSARIALWHIPHALSIQRALNEVTLSWPATGTNFVLEATADLGEANWQGVPGTPNILNDQCVVTLAPGPANQFFRLRRK